MGKLDAAKSAQLQMPISTARSRLVKMLLYRELQISGRNHCYRCLGLIADIDDLSIEHKQPWLHVSPELFWDLDNIAFSHIVCNVSENRGLFQKGNVPPHKKVSEGENWCVSCKGFWPKDNFGKNASHWTSLNNTCKTCRKEYARRNRTQVVDGASLERK